MRMRKNATADPIRDARELLVDGAVGGGPVGLAE
jgi:hypothetical protein